MRVILVPVADRPECAIALGAAFSLANTIGASVIGCHIRRHRHSSVTLPSTLVSAGLANEETEWQATRRPEDSETTAIAAKGLFSSFAEQHDYHLRREPSARPAAIWMEKVGSPNKVIGIMGPMSDLLVLSRPYIKGGNIARQFLAASLLKSSRPVLVLPQTKKRTIGKKICIAWNQSTEATQAVAASMPLLRQADIVTIVTCGAENRAGPKSGQLATYLKYWGIQSEHFLTQGKDEPEAIVAAYKSTNSDLLVMGAYSRNRMSELVFGGVTKYMLDRASIPVLMLHT